MTLAVGLVSWYTCWLLLKLAAKHSDLFDLCQEYLGGPGRWLSWTTSILFGIGILVSYDILMSTTLFDTIEAFRAFAHHGSSPLEPTRYWTPWISAGLVALFVLPLSCIRKFDILVKVNTWSIVFLIYIMLFFVGSSIRQGLGHIPKSALFESHFGWLSGILTAAFVIHNAVINIFKSQRHPEHNIRDLTLGYLLVICTYLIVGSVCFVAYRNSDFVQQFGFIPEDFMVIFNRKNIGALIARISLFLQLLSSYPLLCTITRIQFFGMVLKSQFPGWPHVIGLNIVLIGIGTVVAMFLPKLATVLRFVGSSSGVVLVCLLPTAMFWIKLYREHQKIPVLQSVISAILLLLAVALLIAQLL
jgi:hypothetical protein